MQRVLTTIAVLAAVLATAAGGARAGSVSVLTIAFGSDPPSLDPGLATDTSSAFVVYNTNTPIVRLGPAPALKPEPALAQSWTVQGTHIALHLRRDVRWTNGRPVTAHDVVWSWLRTISPQLGADYAYQFYGIVGAQAYNRCRPTSANGDCAALRSKVAITAPNATTVDVVLTSPQPWFMQQLSHTSFIPVNREAVTKWGAAWTEPGHIVSDGPFTLTSWKHDASLTLTRNPGWYAAGRVHLGQVQLKIITDGATAEQAFDRGAVEVNDTGWPPADTPRVKEASTYRRFPSLGVYYFGFNVKAIRDANERKAMALAIDRRSIVTKIAQEGQVPATAFSPRNMPGAATIDADPFLQPTADLKAARAYMARVKHPVRTVNLVFDNAPGNRQMALAVQAAWRKLGLHVTVAEQSWPQFLKLLGPPPSPTVSAFRFGWIADFPDDINFLGIFQCHSGNNPTNWCDPAYDALLQRATAAQSAAKRDVLYHRAEQLLTGKHGGMPIAPIYWYTIVYQVATNVHGWSTNPMDQTDLTRVRVS